AALDLYFTRHDGQACTIEDWLQVFEDTTGRDLSQFKLWYSQAGTPRVRVDEDFTDGTYSVTFTQSIPDTPGQSDKQPMVIPISLGLIDPSGAEVASTQVLELTETQQTFTFAGLDRKPVPSLLRGFSAPVVLHHDMSAKERLTLLSHDTDMFNRWEATRQLGRDVLLNMVDGGTADDEFVNALITLAADETLDPAFRALCLTLPAQDDIAQVIADANGCPNPMIIDAAHNTLADQIATQGQATFDRLHRTHHVTGHYSPDAVSCAHRALANCVLGYLSRVDGGALAKDQFASANNMTVQLAALAATLKAGVGDVPVTEFYDQWRHERLVVDKWFSVQIGSCPAETAVDVARELAQHPDFTLTNPNRFRALIGPLAMRPAAFHRADGAAYEFVADQLIALDDINPQTTARMTTVFETWKRYDVDRQDMMRAALRRIAAKPNLSRDTGEMVTRLLNA
ncbi:MAG: DUF3458 domain-containing protein, partial [Planktomarina sp.]